MIDVNDLTKISKDCSLTEFVGTTVLDTIGLVIPGIDASLLERMYLKKDYLQVQSLRQYIKETQIPPEKINLPYLPEKLRGEIKERLSQNKNLKLVSSIFDNLEINAAGCHKGAALAALGEILNISRENTAAIGDNGNDREMLEYAGLSIAMGNATEEIKKIAKATTASCEEDGAALAIENYILRR